MDGWNATDIEWAGRLLERLGREQPVRPITEDDFDADGNCTRWKYLRRVKDDSGSASYKDTYAEWHVDYHIRERNTGRILCPDVDMLYEFDAVKPELERMFPITLPYTVPTRWPGLIGETDVQYHGTKPPYTFRISCVVAPDGALRDIDWTWVNYDGSGFTRVSREEYDKVIAGKSSTTEAIRPFCG